MREVLINWLMYLAGMLIYIIVVKIPAFKSRGKATNKPFKFFEWIRADGPMMFVNILIVFMLTLGWEQIEKFSPALMNSNRLIFGLIGLGGNAIVFRYLSKFGIQELEVINIKSNTSDVVTHNKSTDIREITEKSKRHTGMEDIATVDPLNQHK